MGVYLGMIEIKGYDPSFWYNFKPLCEICNNSLIRLSPNELATLLPDSAKGDINFSYDRDEEDQRNSMKLRFQENSLVVFEFEVDELSAHTNFRGERNQTGYKVNTFDMINAHKIRSIETEGFYQIIDKNELLSDFETENIVVLNAIGLYSGSEVLVEHDGFYAGPYVVGYRKTDKIFYIRPQIKKNKYTLCGYKKENCMRQAIVSDSGFWGDSGSTWIVAFPKILSDKEYVDVISTESLLESFKDSIGNESIGDGKIAITDVKTLLSHYETSSLVDKDIPREILTKRKNRLVEILTSESELDDTLSSIAESLCDLLINYKNSPKFNKLIQNIIDKQDDFINKIQGIKIIKDQIIKLEQERDDLQQQNVSLESKIHQKRIESQVIEQTAVEEKKTELLKMDEQYISKKTELDTILEVLKIAGGVDNLSKRQTELQRDVKYLETHKNRLENDSKNLEREFLDKITNHHDKMVGIAFDGFMANKMLRAAAQWEAEESHHSYIASVKAINAVETSEKESDQLIRYLCNTVRIARPNYSNNTIINIAICVAQGFLTVFSGEPGCGKTSICNTIAEVLGLNKLGKLTDPCAIDLKRYIPVSVERGWTSKRDFIGYFNPLSKTFDKSNRRIFDALKLLDIEKREGLLKYPFLVLLDEANLSPMEYYWADFMDVCDKVFDDLDANCQINLGEDNVFSIPETLHFVATINNDHTTETLSPRLIDRAWVITLPHDASLSIGSKIAYETIEPITWQSIKKAFLPEQATIPVMSPEAQKIYDMTLIPHLSKGRISVSPRTEIAIKRYWSVAAKCLEKDEYGNDATIVALDYAIAQKILPKIVGHGEDFAKWLEELGNMCRNNNLLISERILEEIIKRGQMKYYQFFG